MDCDFNEHIKRTEFAMRIEAPEIPQRHFCFLDSIISKDVEIDEVDTYFMSAL